MSARAGALVPVRLALRKPELLDLRGAPRAVRPRRPAVHVTEAPPPVTAAQLRELVAAVVGPGTWLFIAELALAFQAAVDVPPVPGRAAEQPDQLHDARPASSAFIWARMSSTASAS